MTVDVEGLGKITASKEILNEISIAFGVSRDFYLKVGCNALADKCNKVSGSVHRALNDSGYYDD